MIAVCTLLDMRREVVMARDEIFVHFGLSAPVAFSIDDAAVARWRYVGHRDEATPLGRIEEA